MVGPSKTVISNFHPKLANKRIGDTWLVVEFLNFLLLFQKISPRFGAKFTSKLDPKIKVKNTLFCHYRSAAFFQIHSFLLSPKLLKEQYNIEPLMFKMGRGK